MNKQKTVFRNFGVVTVIAVYVLILVGGIVRSTGSGMGCPDWPKCFGQYIPPTQLNELPENYKEIYAEKRMQKNIKFASYLSALGYNEVAQKVKNDPSILIEQDFNPLKTWIEYVNRLIGALIGVFILLTAIGSLAYIKTDKVIPLLAWFSLFLVLFQAWIGAFVVSTNLLGWVVTLHMMLALLLVAVLIYTLVRAYQDIFQPITIQNLSKLNLISILCLVLSVVQIILGTQVREKIDVIASTEIARSNWVESVGVRFYVHRSFSILLLIANLLFIRQAITLSSHHAVIVKWSVGLGAILALEIVSGIVMAYLAVPAVMQPLHLVFANLMFGVQFVLLMIINYEKLFLRANYSPNFS